MPQMAAIRSKLRSSVRVSGYSINVSVKRVRNRTQFGDREAKAASSASRDRICSLLQADGQISKGLTSIKPVSNIIEAGIVVDHRLRTSNRRVFAIGDVAGALQFTHVAGYHAGIVIKNALFRLPAKVSYDAVPWVTYTDPELAHVGMNEAQANDSRCRPSDRSIRFSQTMTVHALSGPQRVRLRLS